MFSTEFMEIHAKNNFEIQKKTEHKLFLSEWEVNVSKDFLQTRMGRRDAAVLTPQRFRRPATEKFQQTNRSATK